MIQWTKWHKQRERGKNWVWDYKAWRWSWNDDTESVHDDDADENRASSYWGTESHEWHENTEKAYKVHGYSEDDNGKDDEKVFTSPSEHTSDAEWERLLEDAQARAQAKKERMKKGRFVPPPPKKASAMPPVRPMAIRPKAMPAATTVDLTVDATGAQSKAKSLVPSPPPLPPPDYLFRFPPAVHQNEDDQKHLEIQQLDEQKEIQQLDEQKEIQQLDEQTEMQQLEEQVQLKPNEDDETNSEKKEIGRSMKGANQKLKDEKHKLKKEKERKIKRMETDKAKEKKNGKDKATEKDKEKDKAKEKDKEKDKAKEKKKKRKVSSSASPSRKKPQQDKGHEKNPRYLQEFEDYVICPTCGHIGSVMKDKGVQTPQTFPPPPNWCVSRKSYLLVKDGKKAERKCAYAAYVYIYI